MSNLTKRDLVVQISKELGIVQSEVSTVIQQALDNIITALASGQDVELRNFGVFEVRLTKSRVGRKPCRLPSIQARQRPADRTEWERTS